jgi:hypothetical protein
LADPGELRSADFDLAFAFARSEAAAYRAADGSLAQAAIDAPRFDHDADGNPRGLLVSTGSDIGRQDRPTIDPLILPADIVEGEDAGDRDVTIFHVFRSPIANGQDDGAAAFEAGIRRRAYYARDVAARIDALMRQPGHHLSIGVVRGFRPNQGGFTWYRGQRWELPGLVASNGAALTDGSGKPLVNAGAERVS